MENFHKHDKYCGKIISKGVHLQEIEYNSDYFVHIQNTDIRFKTVICDILL